MDRAIRDGKIDVVRDLITADPTLIHKPSTAGRIANIMVHRARSSSERRRVRRSSGGYRRVTLKRSTR